MRKLATTLCFQGLISLLSFNAAFGQQITDINLKKAILTTCSTCLDNNGNLLSEARNITSLTVNVDTSVTIKSTKGLEGFTKLQTFSFQGFSFKTHKLDSFPPKLKDLSINADVENFAKFPDSLTAITLFYIILHYKS